MNNNEKTLFIFIDESGNFDFSSKGTKYFSLTSISTFNPLKLRERFLELRYEILKGGVNDKWHCFHATEDKQEVRDKVFNIIKNIDDIIIDCVLAQKNKTNPSLYIDYKPQKKLKKGCPLFKTIHTEEKFYHRISQTLLQYIFRRYDSFEGVDKIIVVLGSLATHKKRGYILKSLKQYLKEEFKKPFRIYFQKTEADINCQIADYCSWAIFINAERGEKRSYDLIKSRIKSVFPIFRRGETEYYEYKK